MIKKYQKYFKLEYLVLPTAVIFFAAFGYLLFSSTGAFSSLAATDFGYMSAQSYSATEIKSIESPSDCQQKGTGQVILITNIDTTAGPQGEAVSYYSALSNKSTWTKRGKLYPVVDEVKLKLIETLKNENKLQGFFQTTDEETIKKLIVSGSYFLNVPVNQSLTTYLYSSAWGQNGQDKALIVEGLPGPDSACKNLVYYIFKKDDQMKNEFPVCLHSKDQTVNYNPKQTFLFPTDKDKGIKEYRTKNPDSEMSLGPCQDEAKIVENVANGQAPSGSTATQAGNNAVAISAVEPAPGTVSVSLGADWNQRVLDYINSIRAQGGFPPLVIDDTVQKLAERRLKNALDGGQCLTGHENFQKEAEAAGIAGGSEITGFQSAATPEQAIDLYQGSDHWKYISNSDSANTGVYKKIGIAAGEFQGGICHLEIFSI